MTPEDQPPAPAARALLVAVGWSVVFGGIAVSTAALVALLVALAIAGSFDGAAQWLETIDSTQVMVQGGAGLAAGLLATYLVGRRRHSMSAEDLRWRTSPGPGRGVALGLLYGLVPALAVIAGAVLVGDARWAWSAAGPWDALVAAGRTMVILAPAALAEEVWFRGVPLVLLAAVLGRGSAVVAVAVVFGVAHLLNPHVTGIGVANVALAGVLLGTVFYGPGGLWAAFGAHLAWNATLGLLGAAVSGAPLGAPVATYQAGGPQWLTGGGFGPEGGLLATMMLGLAVVVAVRQTGSEER